jgi:fatty acid desaturase
LNTQALTRQAIRRAQREAKKQGRALTKEEVLKLHVQTTSAWARTFFVVTGLIGVGIAVICHSSGGPWWITALFALAGLWQVGLGVFGRKELLERELKKVTPGRVADSVLSNILDGLI